MAETPTSFKVSGEANLILPAATSGIHCGMSPESVLAPAQTGPTLADHATSIAGPQIISACNLTQACVTHDTSSVEAKPIVVEELSPVPAATSSCIGKEQIYHNAPLDTQTSLGSKNSVYEENSILGKPPLIYTREVLPPKFPTTILFTDGLKAKVNSVSSPEETSEVNCSVTSEMQDVMREEHIVNAEVMLGAASGSENGTDISKLVTLPACAEPSPSLPIGDHPPSNKSCGSSSDAQIASCQPGNKLKDGIQYSASITKMTAVVSDSTSPHRKMEHESIDSGIFDNHFSSAATSIMQTKNTVMEATKSKTTHGRRKRRKEIHTKADGHKSADIYSASGSLDGNFASFSVEEVVRSSSAVDLKEICTLDAEMGTLAGSTNDNQNKDDFLDWEGDAQLSSEKLRVYSCKHSNDGAEVSKDGYDQKRYSRDFLLTFANSCINLPESFKIGSDIYDAIINVSSEHNANRARIKDRVSATSQVNRHMRSSKLEENYWRKSYPSPVSGRDPLPVTGPAISSWDAAQRGGRGSSRNVSQNQSPSQYTGEILSRAVKEVASQRSISRGFVDHKWQHRSNQGTSSSQVSMPVMHKAEKKYEIGKVSDEEEVKQRQLKAILNKLTPQNFEKLFEQVKRLNIDNIVTLNGVISQIFDKALMEPTFCEMYASFCFSLAGELPNFVKDDEKITFKGLLLNKCQEEFERGEREQAEADKAEEEGGIKHSKGEIEEKRLRARRRMLGNIRLIGELYKKKMLTERIMHECIKKLLGEYQHPDEEDLEALCKLMSTIGEMIDHYRAKVHMDFYFDIIQKLSANSKLSSRIRFMLEDVIDLRNNKWRQRRKVEGPKKIEEVHRDAAKQKTSQSTRSGPPLDYGARGSSASRGSSQVRAYGSQNVNLDTRYQTSNRVMSVPLHQRRSDKSIRLSPQGELGKEMSLCGKPQAPHNILPDVPLSSHHGQALKSMRQSSFTGATSNPTNFQATADTPKSQSWGTADHAIPVLVTPVNPVSQMHIPTAVIKGICYEARIFPEEVLQEKAILTIKEFYR
jgi:translation initiation factor 4G